MLTLNFMAETLAIAIVVLLLGREVKKGCFSWKIFIPAPVVGGVIFSILLLIGHNTEAFSFNFDGVLKIF